MKFRRSYHPDDLKMFRQLQGRTNSAWWQGHPPRHCVVDHCCWIRDQTTEITVSVHPSRVGIQMIDAKTMLTLEWIDEPPGIDFNEFDFGELVPTEISR